MNQLAQNAAAKFNDGMILFADKASEMLEVGTAAGAEDLDGIREGLREALDTGVVLERALDSGMPVTWPVIASIERLVRATLAAYPFLMMTELRDASGEARLAPDQSSLVGALGGRCHNATTTLHRGLEAAYRTLTDAEAES